MEAAQRSRRSRGRAAGGAVLAAALVLAGCSATAPPHVRPSTHAAPNLTGPWSAEFEREYERATSDAVRAALEDGAISDREYAEMKAAYTDCLKAAGITLTSYGSLGSETSFQPPVTPDIAHEAEQECSDESGEYPIAYLYWNARSNPDNHDQVPLIVECFKRNGLVEHGYTVEDYYAGDFPFEADPAKSQRGRLCNTDPNGRLGE